MNEQQTGLRVGSSFGEIGLFGGKKRSCKKRSCKKRSCKKRGGKKRGGKKRSGKKRSCKKGGRSAEARWGVILLNN